LCFEASTLPVWQLEGPGSIWRDALLRSGECPQPILLGCPRELNLVLPWPERKCHQSSDKGCNSPTGKPFAHSFQSHWLGKPRVCAEIPASFEIRPQAALLSKSACAHAGHRKILRIVLQKLQPA